MVDIRIVMEDILMDQLFDDLALYLMITSTHCCEYFEDHRNLMKMNCIRCIITGIRGHAMLMGPADNYNWNA